MKDTKIVAHYNMMLVKCVRDGIVSSMSNFKITRKTVKLFKFTIFQVVCCILYTFCYS